MWLLPEPSHEIVLFAVSYTHLIMLVGRHFADRMPSEHWMIIDDKRKIACIHPKDGTNYLRYLTDEEFDTLQKTEEYTDTYTCLLYTSFYALSVRSFF